MKRPEILILGIVSLSLIAVSFTPGSTKLTPRLQSAMEQTSPTAEIYAWVYFTDKGSNETMRNSIPLTVVAQRSIDRRRKVMEADRLVDYCDLPVDNSYVSQVSALGVKVRQRSKWFNSVSVVGTKAQITSLTTLPFVREIDLLARFRKNDSEMEQDSGTPPSPQEPDGVYSLDYGASLGQVSQINVPAVHDLGNSAQGVLVGVFDNGFRLLTHECFASMSILATYDFVDHKVSVVPNNPSASFGAHGVNTLSTIGGNKPGQLIGPAYGATFILARTENDSSETPIEEDNWVAAIEWADSIGVDVTSTSLGYLAFDAPYPSLTWQDMNGNTAVITRAADFAVGRGIVVVNSAGNNGLNASHNTLGAPADGDSVLTIGAVTSTGTRSSFSSVGPTTSVPPRIKPDVMAQGSSVVVASSTSVTGYTTASGTSFSCPLAAGVAALVVHARPNATPMQIMNSLRATASRAATPDNQYGWGILNALAVINDIPLPIQLVYFTGTSAGPSRVHLDWGTLSEVNNYGFIIDRKGDNGEWTELPNSFVPGHGTTNVPQVYSFVDSAASPAYPLYRLKQIDLDGTLHYSEVIRVDMQTGVGSLKPLSFTLEQNYPNPFNPTTDVRFEIGEGGFVSLRVYDVLGRAVATLVDEELKPGSYERVFDATGLASGTYLCRLMAGSYVATRKILLLR